jgi:hypothetical protein
MIGRVHEHVGQDVANQTLVGFTLAVFVCDASIEHVRGVPTEILSPQDGKLAYLFFASFQGKLRPDWKWRIHSQHASSPEMFRRYNVSKQLQRPGRKVFHPAKYPDHLKVCPLVIAD